MLNGWLTVTGIAFAVVSTLVFAFVFSRYAGLWLRALVSRARIGMPSLVSMTLRRVSPQKIVDAKVMAVQAGLEGIDKRSLESHQLAGGRVTNVVRALIAAHRAKIDLDWNTAAAIDLAGRDVLDAVRMSVDPRVIDCPAPDAPGRNTLDGVARDGIQLKVKARVTVRANLAQLVGGATEETVVARVGEGIVSAIGSCANHKTVLANPMLISQRVQDRGLDAQTAFAIVSIDIANIDVGDNIGARLQIDQAQADMRVARAKAEERRARAVATEQEMIAKTRENQAQVVAAEARIPRAQACAFREGNIGTRDHRRRRHSPRTVTAPRAKETEQL
ncbi:flotillin-like protein FloA [Symmachiella dynata]|uniref:flotillin-like protein FloA n=1 Tax=Symmachiella dynata TaxID=2527995 RepID=UPI0030EC09C9